MGGARLGGGSFDAISGSLNNMFDWSKGDTQKLILDTKTGNSAS
jgi:phospholipase C